MFESQEALPLATRALTWEDVEISAAPEQGLQANFIDIFHVKKKKKKSREVCCRKGSAGDKGSLLAERHSDVGWGHGKSHAGTS